MRHVSGAPLPGVAPSWGGRLDGIEGLRGLAAASVMAAHTVILLRDTAEEEPFLSLLTGLSLQGLTLFFVLSRFLLFRPYASVAMYGRPAPRWRDFLRNRVLRIWPAYVVILLASGFLSVPS